MVTLQDQWPETGGRHPAAREERGRGGEGGEGARCHPIKNGDGGGTKEKKKKKNQDNFDRKFNVASHMGHISSVLYSFCLCVCV